MKPNNRYFYSELEWDRLGCGSIPESRIWQSADTNQNEYLVYPEVQSIDSDEKINPYSQV